MMEGAERRDEDNAWMDWKLNPHGLILYANPSGQTNSCSRCYICGNVTRSGGNASYGKCSPEITALA